MEIQHNQVYNEDCLQFMKQLPNNYFDLIITDPPYGINIAKNGSVGGAGKNWIGKMVAPRDYGKSDWDNSTPTEEYFKEMQRVSKNQIIFGGTYFCEFLQSGKKWIVWDKKATGNFSKCELAWTSFDGRFEKFEVEWNGFIQGDEFGNRIREKRYHHSQKPVALGNLILNQFAKDGDLIFDPFAGSGSFLVACKQKGFKFVGCEINKDYVEIIKKRLTQLSVDDFTLPNGNSDKSEEFNMDDKVSAIPTPKCPSDTSHHPNIKRNRSPSFQARLSE